MLCPTCKKESKFLYPALNQCRHCLELIAFCTLNDETQRLGLWQISELAKLVKKKVKKCNKPAPTAKAPI
jgi:hypothetical protein